MHICNNCKSHFREPKETGYCSDRRGIEAEYLCPCCDSNAVEEAVTCRDCGEEFSEDDMQYINVTNSYDENIQGYICNDCLYTALEEIFG